MQTRISSQSHSSQLTLSDITESSKTFDENKYIELDETMKTALLNLQYSKDVCRDYNNLFEKNELLYAAKKQFLFDIKQLQELASIYVDKQYQYNISVFYQRVESPPKYHLLDQLDLYVETRKHIRYLVQKLTTDKNQYQEACNSKINKQIIEKKDFFNLYAY